MAKSIKAIKCPHCGSAQKTAISDNIYRCRSCHTEYFLDDDDINININHRDRDNTTKPNADSATAKKVMAGSVIVVVLFFFLAMLFSSLGGKNRSDTSANATNNKNEFRYGDNYVFTNTTSGKAVLLRLGREQLRSDEGNYDLVNTYAVFIDPVTKAEIKRQLIFKGIRRLDNYNSSYSELSNGDIYINYNDQTYFKINQENNSLTDVTHTLLQQHPEASSGIAKLSMYGGSWNFGSSWDVLTNDGKKFRYLPVSGRLFSGDDYQAVQAAEIEDMPATFFQLRNSDDQLMKVQKKGSSLTDAVTDPERKYFGAEILFQDSNCLLLQTNTTAAPQAPVHLQRIDVNTGKVLWTTQASTLEYTNGARCKEGFALCYRGGSDVDYISGVFVYSPQGRLLHDYKIGRGD